MDGSKIFDQLTNEQKAQARRHRPRWSDDRLRQHHFIVHSKGRLSKSLFPISIKDQFNFEERSKGDLRDYGTTFHLSQD